MDWTFEEWGLAFFLLLAGLVLIVFVAPAGALIGLATWRAATVVSRTTSPDSPRKHFWAFCGAVAALCLMISTNPMTWVRPLWFPFALIAAVLLPIYVVRNKGTFINWNRPFGYWLRLPRLVANGPRELTPREFDAGPLMLGMDLDDRHTDLGPVQKIETPPKGGKSPHLKELVALEIAPPVKRRAPRHKFVERTANGWRVGGTEYRLEWTF